MKIKRVVCWYSCGVTSAVAAKIAYDKFKDKYPIEIVYCDTGSEHHSNDLFTKQVSQWIGKDIKILKSKIYMDIWEVFTKTRYLAGVNGARCTSELKKVVRRDFEDVHDLQVFGFDNSEAKRIERFGENNPEVNTYFPLMDESLSKQYCIDIITENNIDLPTMYKMGYKNNNCIGCVKGQMGYWNKIRVDFPAIFSRMAKVERELNVALCKTYAGDGKRKRVFLDELKPGQGKYESELETMKCGLVCGE